MKSIDGGGSWTPINAGLGTKSVTALAVDPQNPQILYAAAGTLFKSTDGGMIWNPTGLSIGVYQVTIDAQNPGTVYAIRTASGAINGGIWKSIDGGTSWQDLSAALPAVPYTIALGPKNSATIYAGSAEDIVVLNWQIGTSESHSVPAGILPGTWTIDGVRAHQDPENHAGSFAQVSAAITVSP